MAVYTVRPGFTVRTPIGVFVGGDEVDLDPIQFAANKHKLENVERDEELDVFFTLENDCCYPEPYVSSINPSKILSDSRQTLTIIGSFFTPKTTVDSESFTTVTVEFVSSSRIRVVVETSDDLGPVDLTIDNGRATLLESAIEIFDKSVSIVDFRSGGTPFGNDAIETRSDMSWRRSSNGLEFSGRNPFGSWARLVGDNDAWVWKRADKRDLSLIFTNTSSFMLGIGSRANNPNSGTQYYQAEILGYFGSATSFGGIFGNNGTPGAGVNDQNPVAINNLVKKITFTSNGEVGSFVSVYELPSGAISDWSVTGGKIGEYQITSAFAADEPEIMPFLIPRNGNSTLFLGMILL